MVKHFSSFQGIITLFMIQRYTKIFICYIFIYLCPTIDIMTIWSKRLFTKNIFFLLKKIEKHDTAMNNSFATFMVKEIDFYFYSWSLYCSKYLKLSYSSVSLFFAKILKSEKFRSVTKLNVCYDTTQKRLKRATILKYLNTTCAW